jgi:hypothetical protein
MAPDHVIKQYFSVFFPEQDFIQKTYSLLENYGFTSENALASVCVCRDEISQTLLTHVKHKWGEAFNFSSLAGMFTAGKTGLKAAIHHAPRVDSRERYVFYVIPHIAIDESGKTGFCKRKGIKEDSSACGALCLFLDELYTGTLHIKIDEEDIEESLLKRRLIKEITYGDIPSLLELTHITRKVIQEDLEHAIAKVVDTSKSDYAMLTGIMVHALDANYIVPDKSYIVLKSKKKALRIQ